MKPIAFLVVWCALLNVAYGQNIRVKVEINDSRKDEIQEQLTSKMSKFLREFKDITVTDDSPDIELHLLAATSRLDSGKSIGFSFTLIITQPLENEELDRLSTNKAVIYKPLRDWYKSKSFFLGVYTNTLPFDGLDQNIKALTELIDSHWIEPIRKSRQREREKQR